MRMDRREVWEYIIMLVRENRKRGEGKWGAMGWKMAICWVKRCDITQYDWTYEGERG